MSQTSVFKYFKMYDDLRDKLYSLIGSYIEDLDIRVSTNDWTFDASSNVLTLLTKSQSLKDELIDIDYIAFEFDDCTVLRDKYFDQLIVCLNSKKFLLKE